MKKLYKTLLTVAVVAAMAPNAGAYTYDGATFDKVYLMGDASLNGWNVGSGNDAYALTETESGVFVGQHLLNPGNFRVLFEPGDGNWGRCLGATAGDGTELTVGEAMDAQKGDANWHISTGGAYKITADFNRHKFTVENAPEIYAVGNGVADWNPANAVAIANVGGQTYRATLPISRNAFKLLGNRSWDYSITADSVEGINDGDDVNYIKMTETTGVGYGKTYAGDYKWLVGNEGTYTLEVTLGNEPSLSIYAGTAIIVGTVTDPDWSFTDGYKFKQDAANPYIFTWSGDLEAGAIKFVGARYEWDDNNDTHLMATQDGMLLDHAAKCISGGADDRWNVPTAGHYDITIDVKNLTVNAVTDKAYTVYADVEGWENVYIYTYLEDGENSPKNADWPGVAMKHNGKLHELTINEAYDHVIFSDGNGNQIDGYAVSNAKADHVFNIVSVEGGYAIHTDGTYKLFEGGNVFLVVNGQWTGAKCHYWGVEGSNNEWPGADMESLSRMAGDMYVYEVPAGVAGVVINDGNGKQTHDLRHELGDGLLVTVGEDGGIMTGVEGIDAEQAAAVYYNLQGVRVDAPAQGLYIVVRGKTVTKEIIR